MLFKCTLNMKDLVVNGTHIDRVTIDWVQEFSQEEYSRLSAAFNFEDNFLIKRMQGLQRVGEPDLIFERLTHSESETA